MKVGIIVVRKQWNNAPYYLSEGIKRGIEELISEKYEFKDIDFTFVRFTIHNPDNIYISPEDVKDFDVLLIPFWIGERIFTCNFKELKEKLNIKILVYTGRSPYCKNPPFDYDPLKRAFNQGKLSDIEWENFNLVDKFLVAKKIHSYEKEFEVGLGQFEWITLDKSEENFIAIDFCKKQWDEFIWQDFGEVWDEIKKKFNVQLIQLGSYPLRFKNSGIFDRPFVHYSRICKLYSKIKIWISMNESFGYPIIENRYAGNFILLHEKAEIPNFHINSDYVYLWNKKNIFEHINRILKIQKKETPTFIRNEFSKKNKNFISWKNCVLRIIDEIHQYR